MTLSVFITVITGHDKPQPLGCLLDDVVRELMEEKHASRQVTVPAVMLEKVMALAGSEMKRLYAVGSENGGDGDAFVREEREAMDVVLQALDGEHMS